MPSQLDKLLAEAESGPTGKSRLLELAPELAHPAGERGVPPEAAAEAEAMRFAGGEQEQNRMLLEGSLMGLGGLVGGAAGGARLIPQVTGEIIGTFLGGKAAGMPTKEAGKASLIAGGAGATVGGFVRAGTRVAGKMAGLEADTVKAGIRDPRILARPPREGDLELSGRLAADTEKRAMDLTVYHKNYQELLAQRSSRAIDAQPIYDAFQKRITGADHPILRAADRQVEAMQLRFLERVSTGGRITIGDLDAYIRENFTDPLKGAYARGSEAETVRRLMEIRGDLTNLLYSSIGPGAAPSQALTKQALTKREAVENIFGIGTESRPSSAGAEAIRTIRSQSGSAQRNRDVLRAYDEEYGTNFLEQAEKLSMQREWAGDTLAIAYAIDSVLQPSRPSFVRGIMRPIARLGARTAAPSGPIAAGAAGFISPREKSRRRAIKAVP